jgi:YaiO family outer membrane protein
MQQASRIYALFILMSLCFGTLHAQEGDSKPEIDTISSDGLFQAARTAAFDQKNYPLAKRYCLKALEKSPNYADIRIFLGRLYTWTDQVDSAKACFETVLQREPDYEDASIAYADLQYWNDHYKETIAICDEGLKSNPTSKDLLIRKAKALAALKDYAGAMAITSAILKTDNSNAAARSLETSIKDDAAKNKISITYDYTYFDKQFDAPWHLVSVDYGRSTKLGSIIGRINYANRFSSSATQFEIDAYPRISKTFYSYANIGFGDQSGIFPKFKGGFSLYANLPKSFEAELGFRYMKFSGDPTWIYTAYLGKYTGSWLLGARTYITPSNYVKQVSVTYNVLARYYFGGADDYFGFVGGYGLSPDDRYNNIQLNGTPLDTYKLGAAYKKKLNIHNILTTDFTWFNQEYLPGTKGNQYTISVGWLFRF